MHAGPAEQELLDRRALVDRQRRARLERHAAPTRDEAHGVEQRNRAQLEQGAGCGRVGRLAKVHGQARALVFDPATGLGDNRLDRGGRGAQIEQPLIHPARQVHLSVDEQLEAVVAGVVHARHWHEPRGVERAAARNTAHQRVALDQRGDHRERLGRHRTEVGMRDDRRQRAVNVEQDRRRRGDGANSLQRIDTHRWIG